MKTYKNFLLKNEDVVNTETSSEENLQENEQPKSFDESKFTNTLNNVLNFWKSSVNLYSERSVDFSKDSYKELKKKEVNPRYVKRKKEIEEEIKKRDHDRLIKIKDSIKGIAGGKNLNINVVEKKYKSVIEEMLNKHPKFSSHNLANYIIFPDRYKKDFPKDSSEGEFAKNFPAKALSIKQKSDKEESTSEKVK